MVFHILPFLIQEAVVLLFHMLPLFHEAADVFSICCYHPFLKKRMCFVELSLLSQEVMASQSLLLLRFLLTALSI